MKYNPEFHHRRSIRLKNYDYSKAGFYFITICTQYRMCFFGEIINGNLLLNDAGRMVDNIWLKMSNMFPIILHEYVVMPNHFHGIVEITNNVGANPCGCPDNNIMNDCPDNNVINGWRNHNTKGLAQGATPTKLSDIIGAFKSMTTNQYIKNVKTNNWQAFEKRLWQRNYYEHIVRDKKSYLTISQYIKNNPRNW